MTMAQMNFIQRFFGLTLQAASVSVRFMRIRIGLFGFVVYVILIIMLIIILIKKMKLPVKNPPFFLLFVNPILILLLGSVLPDDTIVMSTHSTIVINMIMLMQVITSVYLVYKVKGFRWLTLGVCLLFAWFSCCAWFVVGMWITKTYL